MILEPIDAARLVNTGAKVVFYVPGSGEGKRWWWDAVRENLSVIRNSALRDVGIAYSPMASDTITDLRFATAARIMQLYNAEYCVIDDHIPEPLIESSLCSARAVAAAWGGRVVEVDNFLTNDERTAHAVPPVGLPKPDPTRPPCIIVDLDGTLFDSEHRRPYGDVAKIKDDKIHAHVEHIVLAFDYAMTFFVTGRGGERGEFTATYDQLVAHELDTCQHGRRLLARRLGDNRRDDVIKLEAYIHNIAGRYNPVLVLDDRPRVVRMWNRLGLPVLQCNPYIKGEF